MAKEQEFYKPAEACRIAEVAPYVLRYWETEFPALAENKEKGAAKLYSSREVKIIARIRQLLYDEGFTVAGAKKRLEAEIVEGRFEDGARPAPLIVEPKPTPKISPAPRPVPPPRPVPVVEKRHAEPAFLAEPPPASKAAPPPASSGFTERKRVVKELKEIVKLLDRGRKR